MVRIVGTSIALVFLGLAVSFGVGVSAEGVVGEEDPCRDACELAHEECLGACSEHSNSIECDGKCRAAFEDCNLACG